MAAISPNSPIAPLPLPQPSTTAPPSAAANAPRFADEMERVADRAIERPAPRQRQEQDPAEVATSADTEPAAAPTEAPRPETAGGASETAPSQEATVDAAGTDQLAADPTAQPGATPIAFAAVVPPSLPVTPVPASASLEQVPLPTTPSDSVPPVPVPPTLVDPSAAPATPSAMPAPSGAPLPTPTPTPAAGGPIAAPTEHEFDDNRAGQAAVPRRAQSAPPAAASPAAAAAPAPSAVVTPASNGSPPSALPAAITELAPEASAIEPPVPALSGSPVAATASSDAASIGAAGEAKAPAAAPAAVAQGGASGPPDRAPIAPPPSAPAPVPAPVAMDAIAVPIAPLVETTPAPTAAPATPAPQPAAVAAAPAMQVAVHIARALDDGSRQFSLRLDPPELGRVDVHVELDHDGRVAAVISTDRSDTLDLLQRDARGLERALNDAGLRADRHGLSFSLRDPSGDGRQPTGRSYAGAARWGGAGSDDVDAMPGQIVAATRALRALDISV